ncbi:hypothetical protein CL622_03165 [archaeon]|nr:hypothetical protein [archaeon]
MEETKPETTTTTEPITPTHPTPGPHHQGPTHPKEETITMSKSSMWKGAAVVLGILLVVSVFTGGFGRGDGADSGATGGAVTPPQAPPAAGNTPPPPSPTITLSLGDTDPILGDKDAPITVVEFSDFQCPFCERAFSGAVTELKNSQDFKDGKVNFAYLHFPLNSIHPLAQKAAEASECANRQDKFFEYHDMLFANQHALDIASLKKYAADLSLDTGEFNKCLDTDEAAGKVSADLGKATAAGGRGTPYFVVLNNDNGETQTVSGAVPFAQLDAAIKALA